MFELKFTVIKSRYLKLLSISCCLLFLVSCTSTTENKSNTHNKSNGVGQVQASNKSQDTKTHDAKDDKSQKQNQDTISNYVLVDEYGILVSLRFPASLFFIPNSSNLIENFDSHLGQLVKMIAKYDHQFTEVIVHFPVTEKNVRAKQVAENQSQRFVTRLDQHLRSRLTNGKGKVVLKEKEFNPKIAAMGNYIELLLTKEGYIEKR